MFTLKIKLPSLRQSAPLQTYPEGISSLQPQILQLAPLPPTQVGRDLYLHLDEMIAAAAAMQIGDAFFLQPKNGAGLGAGRNL